METTGIFHYTHGLRFEFRGIGAVSCFAGIFGFCIEFLLLYLRVLFDHGSSLSHLYDYLLVGREDVSPFQVEVSSETTPP